MKTQLIFLLLLSQFITFTALSVNDTIQLQPEIEKTYIYEFTESEYMLTDDLKPFNPFEKTKTIKIRYTKAQPENKALLLVTLEKNIAIRPNRKPAQIKDYKYPAFRDGYYSQKYSDFYESLLCRALFKYDFDFKTSKITLVNRDEILEKVHSVLKEKGFDEKGIRKEIRLFNEDGIPLFSEIIQSIYRVPTGSFDKKTVEQYESKVELIRPNSIFTLRRLEVKPGLFSLTIKTSQEKKYLLNSNTVFIDSSKYNFKTVNNQKYPKLKHHETNISLKSIKNTGDKHIKIAGKIENQRHKKVIVSWLKKPFGTTFHQETVFLDENNSFLFETQLAHAQFIYLQFGHNSSDKNLPMLLLYAEPGSEIHFNATGETFPWAIEFRGDFKNANTMLSDFRKKHPVFQEKFNLYSLQWYSYKIEYSNFERVLSDFENYFESQKDNVDNNAYQYIKNEIKAQLMLKALDYFIQKKMYESRAFSNPFYIKNSINWSFLEDNLNNFDINKSYNRFGIHSRVFAKRFLSYNIGLVRKTYDIGFPEYSTTNNIHPYEYSNDLPLHVEFAKTILSGPALYGEIADKLFKQKQYASNGESQTETYIQKITDEYFDLLLRVSNSEELNHEIKGIVDTHLKWKNKEYVPKTKFFNPNGDEVHMKDFLGKKPTIFYVAKDWASERYYFDDLSEENQDFNYVLIVEGSNFTEWTDYVKAAEPKAHQLFMFNDTQHLNDIFKVNYSNFILYDENGDRIAYAGNPLAATKLMKRHLQIHKKKELNKSQLQIIVIVLSTLLIVFIIVFATWKWRIRQRFRKEAQFRRLKELELTAIRSQMNPHFLFNSLNSVQNLVQQNKGREAHLYLADFAGLIRKVLQNSEKEEVSLAEELEMIEQYLNLEKLRFNFVFQISVVPEIDNHNTLVPSMLLQPFVENAVIHGLQNKAGEKTIKIEISKTADGLKIVINDNGIGREAARKIAKAKNGKGTKLMQERLQVLQEKQGEKYELKIVDITGEESGTQVEILIPEE